MKKEQMNNINEIGFGLTGITCFWAVLHWIPIPYIRLHTDQLCCSWPSVKQRWCFFLCLSLLSGWQAVCRPATPGEIQVIQLHPSASLVFSPNSSPSNARDPSPMFRAPTSRGMFEGDSWTTPCSSWAVVLGHKPNLPCWVEQREADNRHSSFWVRFEIF